MDDMSETEQVVTSTPNPPTAASPSRAQLLHEAEWRWLWHAAELGKESPARMGALSPQVQAVGAMLQGLAALRRETAPKGVAHAALDTLLQRSEGILAEGLASGRFTGDEIEAAQRVLVLFRQHRTG